MSKAPGNDKLTLAGYVDPWSVAPGEQVKCMVSCDAQTFDAELVELVGGGPRPHDEGSALRYRAVAVDTNGSHPGRRQPLMAGSYVRAEGRNDQVPRSGFLSLSAWVWPTAPGGRLQGLVSMAAGEDSVGLGIADDGSAALFTRSAAGGQPEVITTGVPVEPDRWYLLAATVDLAGGEVELFQLPQRPYPLGEVDCRGSGTIDVASVPAAVTDYLLGCAWLDEATTGDGTRQRATGCFDGKLDRPTIALARLSSDLLDDMRRDADSGGPVAAARLAQWDLSEGISTRLVTDVSGNGAFGLTYNSPTRAVTGHDWTGEVLDWRYARREYGAIHFHADDMDDACWEPSFELTVPQGTKSGAYGVRLTSGSDEYVVPLFVRPAPGTPTAKVALLVPTFSYMAYSNFESSAVDAAAMTGQDPVYDPVDSVINAHPELGWSLYNHHGDGSGIAYVTRRRPMMDMQPDHGFWLSGGGGWAFSSDMYLVDWLNAHETPFDVITDEDLHFQGQELISSYRVVITGSHPEYVSSSMWDAVEGYLDSGGRLMYLGGNGFYWVTNTFPDRRHVVEIRRGQAGTRTWEGAPGEGHLSATGEPGGLWRHRGRAPQTLVGVGFCAQGGGGSAGYTQTADRADPRVQFIFEGVSEEEDIGAFGNNMGGAAGDEIDRVDAGLGTPSHALVVATSAGRHNDFYQHVVEEVPVMMPDQGGTTCPDVRADMTFFETNNGGAVFTSASIDWTASLSENGYDNNVARITHNVLNHFLR